MLITSFIMKNKERTKGTAPESRHMVIGVSSKKSEHQKTGRSPRRHGSSTVSQRKKKIQAIRQQISIGKYDTDEKRKVAIDRLLEKLLCQK